MRFGVAVSVVLALGVLSLADAYSFLSCTDYDQAQNLCYGYPRKYIQWVGGASHAYNLQADISANVDQTTVSVDPLWQNRSVVGSAFAAYDGGYPMASAVSGQELTLTWPRTAEPDGDAVTSPSASVYFWPNATINAGSNFNMSADPTLAQFQQFQLANLPFNDNDTCQVAADDQKYDLAAHCTGTITVPADLDTGIYTFLWYWIIDQPALFRIYPQVFEVLVRSPTGLTCAAASDTAAARQLPPRRWLQLQELPACRPWPLCRQLADDAWSWLVAEDENGSNRVAVLAVPQYCMLLLDKQQLSEPRLALTKPPNYIFWYGTAMKQ